MSAEQQQQQQPQQAQQQQTSTVKEVKLIKNAVQKDGVLKEQVATELRTLVSWEKKWYFMRDSYKTTLEEAAKEGLSEEALLKLRTVKAGFKPPKVDSWTVKPSGKIPTTSTGRIEEYGMIGWRSSRGECAVERFGPLYISPRHTIDPPEDPPQPPQKYIILG